MENWTREDSVAAMEASYRRGGGRARTVVWLIGLPLLVGLIGVTAYVISQSKLDWNLPGSMQSLTAGILGQPSPSPKATVVARAPLPPSSVPTSPASSTTPASSASPGVDDPAALFAAFIADPHASYHLDSRVAVSTGGMSMTFVASIDQSGSDESADVKISTPTKKVDIKVVIKGGMAYAKVPGKGWVGTSDLSTYSGDETGFAQIPANEIQYVGPEMHGGANLQHLHILTLPQASLDMLAQAGCQATDPSWDIWVRADGRPVAADFAISCTINGSQATATATYQFTRVGKQIDIVAPRKYTQN